jgi:PAS domain S-box-containing protein
MKKKPTYEELELKIEQLEESEKKYRQIFETAMVGIYRTRIHDGKFLAANQALAKLMGYDSVEQFVEQYATSEHYTDPKRREELLDQIKTHGRVDGFKVEMIRVDGSPFTMEISAAAYPELGYIEGVVTDITERKLAEEALRESESKFRNLFDVSPQAISLSELETGKLMDVNHKLCELTKYSKEEILGLNAAEAGLYCGADRTRFRKALQVSGEVKGFEMDFKTKDNSVLHAHIFARIIQIAGVSYILCVFHDRTEEKRLEAQLRQAHKMESIVFVARNRLERLGYQVETKTDPVEALELFREKPERFDLVITDMTMPRMTGDLLVKEILKIRADMPTILCTGFSEKIDEVSAKKIGIRQYIEKPINRSDLAKMIRKVLQ